MSELNDMYNSLCISTFRDNYNSVISPGHPKVNYSSETIQRCFLEKVNSGHVYEIDPTEKSKVNNNPLYKTWAFDWKVTGPERSVVNHGVVEIVGVVEFNELTVESLRKSGFKNVDSIITNMLEFWQGY